MDRQQFQVSDEERDVAREESRRRRRKKAITSSSSASMDQVNVEFVLPTAARGGSGPDSLLLEVPGNWTVEQVKAQVWMKAVSLSLCPDFYQRFSPDHCILLYQKKGTVCEIYDKHQVFQTLDCIRYWRALKKDVGRIQLAPRPQQSEGVPAKLLTPRRIELSDRDSNLLHGPLGHLEASARTPPLQ
ncbi:phosphatidylinositol 4,5-bisphosphate 3-kinase catalytic subunit gamma isoform-like, partial [Fundulus heteroclitus]|uniref:phosphatidylinositol 4,5-bisphosphate 3-kinase catalytic subunit gamma isoform-like n=1 Tax=Fundulus heteroclitus TaxID=8078 RepID=UPI00165AE6D5